MQTQTKRYTIYKAEDHLFVEPEKPEYDTITNNEYQIVGYRMTNMINVCRKGELVPAIPHPNNDHVMLVYGKLPVYGFLLKPVGAIKNVQFI